MNRTYQDSKEFPLYNFERVQSTGDFFYTIKGYDYGDKPKRTQEECKVIYESIVEDYLITMNAKNNELEKLGKLNFITIELSKFKIVKQAIELHLKSLKLGGNGDILKEFLKKVKVQKNDDLNKQLDIINKKISKLENDQKEISAKLDNGEQKESDINEMITNVELALERSINLKEVSLYRFGIMQDQAIKKIEIQNKNGG